jgi:serine/threonine protein kinase
MSPELASYKMRKGYYGDYKFTVKNDVFALAMVFHYYWSGENFSYPQPKRGPYLYNAVLEGVPITVSGNIPQWLEAILRKMIDRQPENRPSMGEVLEMLKQVDVTRPSDDTPPVAPREETKVENNAESNGFVRGEKFPEDAVSFEVLANGKVKFVYNDDSKMALSLEVAVKKQYITEK